MIIKRKQCGWANQMEKWTMQNRLLLRRKGTHNCVVRKRNICVDTTTYGCPAENISWKSILEWHDVSPPRWTVKPKIIAKIIKKLWSFFLHTCLNVPHLVKRHCKTNTKGKLRILQDLDQKWKKYMHPRIKFRKFGMQISHWFKVKETWHHMNREKVKQEYHYNGKFVGPIYPLNQ